MAGIPKVKVTFDADLEQLKRGVKGATSEVEGFGSKVANFGKKAAAAFAVAATAAAAYATKLAVDGVRAAIQDEAAQAKLATTLRNVVSASDDQIQNLEDYVTQTSLATGVTDDQLRPSLDRLVRSTKDVEEAQKLQTLALDISAGSGKSLSAVTEALAKAYDGNFAALKKLGVPLDESIIKSKDFDAATAALSKTFADQASVQAETFAGKMARLQVAFDEGKETVGSFILDAITPLVSGFVNKIIPAIQDSADTIGTKLQPVFKSLGDFFNNVLIPAFKAFYDFIKTYIVPILEVTLVPVIKALFDAFNKIGDALATNKDKLQPLADAFKIFADFIRDTIAPIIGTFITGAIGGLAGVVTALIDLVADITDAVDSAFTKIKTFFTTIKNFIYDNSKAVWSPLYDGIKAVLNSIIAIWNKLDFEIDITVPDWVPLIGGKGFKVADIFPDVPLLADGGIVTKPTLAMIGEAGAEAVVPLTGSNRPDMGNTYNITVNGALDAEGTARTIVRLLNSSLDRGTGGAGAFRAATA